MAENSWGGEYVIITNDITVVYKEEHNSLIDYKFYCFHGEPKFLYISSSELTKDGKNDCIKYLDLNWNPTPFQRMDHPQLTKAIERPAGFEKMIELSRSLSNDIPFLRTDFYFINNRVYFSELTFYPGSGFSKFSPDEWERKIGEWIQLPIKHK